LRADRQVGSFLLPFVGSIGTIVIVGEHRIRLTDDDILLINAALRARLAALRGLRRRRYERLLERLEEGGRGNPRWRFGSTDELRAD
jgi:hypothetical protein